jgi:hypothetical protein
LIQRGVAYEITGGKADARGIVVTKTSWNDRMLDIGMFPMMTPREVRSPYLAYERGFAYDAATIVAVPREFVGEARFTPDDATLAALERQLGDLLELHRLTSDPPRGMRPPAGPIDYPQWGEIYYIAGQRFDGETKRYVVVSGDRWNQQKQTVLVVRLTSQPKFPSDEFPELSGYQACCGELTAVSAHRVELRQRPAEGARRVGLTDMAAIGRGIINTHVLRTYLDPIELEVVS